MLCALIFIDGNADPFNTFEPPARLPDARANRVRKCAHKEKPMRDFLRHRRDMPVRKTIIRALIKRG